MITQTARRRACSIWTGLAGAISVLSAAPAAASPAGTVVVRGGRTRVTFERGSGRIVGLAEAGGAPVCATPPGGSLWRLRYRDGSTLTTAQAGPARVDANPSRGAAFTWRVGAMTVRVTATPSGDHVDLTTTVTKPPKDVLSIAVPADLAFDPGSLRRVVFPSDLGIALKAPFYRPQADERLWKPRRIGPTGLQRVAGLAVRIPPADGPPTDLAVTDAGRRLLGDALAGVWASQRRVVNRPPERTPDLTLVDSAAGPYLAAHRVGHGWLIRLSGYLQYDDAPLAISTVQQLLSSPATPWEGRERRRVVLLALRRGPPSGGWSDAPIRDWRAAWRTSAWFVASGLPAIEADSTQALVAALRDPATRAVVNPYGEYLPVGAASWEAMAKAVRAFLEAGGVWVETGGHPFYSALRPSRYLEIGTGYPTGFADFASAETVHGTAAVYGVQNAREAAHLFVPAAWRSWGDARGGHVGRSWETFVGAGKSWTAPPVRLLAGRQTSGALEEYRTDNGFVRTLADKVRPDVLDRWEHSLLINVGGGSLRDITRMLDRLPTPAAVHLSDYLRGGFDKQYPDLLPPNPAKGTPEDLAALFGHAHRLGDLVVPYTNCTWWCDDPRGPTFQRVGDAPLLRGLDGQPKREVYGPNWGWSICPWHPAVLAATDRMWQEFTARYPADVLFQDQNGMRSLLYDTNPASPTPYAYVQGMLNLSARTAAHIPVSTEHGVDRLIDCVSQFRGMTWQLVPFPLTPKWLVTGLTMYRDWMPPDAWEVYPLAQALAHDRVLFGHHGGGPFVSGREQLVWTLALGYQASLEYYTSEVESLPRAAWMHYVDRVQQTVIARYLGQPLRSFRYLRGSGEQGVVEAVYGDVRIVANLTAAPVADGDAIIAPKGFHARAPGLEAGILTRRQGADWPAGRWFIREGEQTEWFFEPEARAGMVPEEWTRTAPSGRQAPPRFVGVLRLGPDADWRSDWASITPAQWLDAVRGAAPVKEGRLAAREVASVEALADALSHPADWLAIVNPHAEVVPVSPEHDLAAMTAALREYVRGGGTWVEVGGYPFFWAARQGAGDWHREAIGILGMNAIGLSGCDMRASEEPALALSATPEGRALLGDGWAQAVAGLRAVTNRPPLEADQDITALTAANGLPYLVGHRLGGWGWLWRFCGGNPPPEVALRTTQALVEALWATPLAAPGGAPTRRSP